MRPGPLNATYIYPEFLSRNDDGARRDALLSEFITGCTVAQRIGAPSHRRRPSTRYSAIRRAGRTWGAWKTPIGSACAFFPSWPILPPTTESASRSSPWDLIVPLCAQSPRSSQIVAAVNRPNVGFTIDSYNIFPNGGSNDFSAIAEMDGSLIHVAHLMNADDVPESERSQDKRCFPVQGR